MPSLRSRPSIGVCFALGVAAVLACNSGHDEEDKNQFRDDVIWCEEAIARLEKCCPSFDPGKVLCNFYYSYDEGCIGGPTVRSVVPALSKSDSLCVRATSCEALVAQNVCARAEAAGLANQATQTSSSGGMTTTSSSTSSSSSSTTSSSGTSGGTTPPAVTGVVCP